RGQERTVNLNTLGLNSSYLFEFDSRIRSEKNNASIKFTLDSNKTRFVTIKDPATQMVLGSIRLQGVEVYSIETTGMSVAETLEDGWDVLGIDVETSSGINAELKLNPNKMPLTLNGNIEIKAVAIQAKITAKLFSSITYTLYESEVYEVIQGSNIPLTVNL
ncbi:MAG: hypothetical protein ACRC37_01325, partial [Lentisphaeria bacterium]